MEDKEKAVLAIGGLGLAGLTGYLLTRKPKPLPPEAEGAEITIEIIGPDGEPLKSNSPIEIVEGESYPVRLTVTNLSTKGGQPWEATFTIVVAAAAGGIHIIFPTDIEEYFTGGQTRSFDFPMIVPLGMGGLYGDITALVESPLGVAITSAVEFYTIVTVRIIYAAEVVIGV